mgnify:CR=1 FL=1
MYLIYVDESGDTGIRNSLTKYFVLSALVVHETKWNKLLDEIVNLRRKFKEDYGLKINEEIHAARFFTKPGELARIEKHDRLQICKRIIDFLESLDYISLVNVVVNKAGKSEDFEVFETAWQYLIQRIHNTIGYGNFPSGFSREEKGLIIPDETEAKKLNKLVRKMRRYNPVPNMNQPGYRMIETDLIIEDPYYKSSKHSLFHQLVDVNAYFLFQMHQPNSYVRKKKAYNFFKRYDKVLCKVASTKNELGIVYI